LQHFYLSFVSGRKALFTDDKIVSLIRARRLSHEARERSEGPPTWRGAEKAVAQTLLSVRQSRNGRKRKHRQTGMRQHHRNFWAFSALC
jgi:hypothetical protein